LNKRSNPIAALARVYTTQFPTRKAVPDAQRGNEDQKGKYHCLVVMINNNIPLIPGGVA